MDDAINIAMYVSRNCLVVPIQTELHDEQVRRLQTKILNKINDTEIKAMVIDISGMVIIDSFLAESIFSTAKMAALLGARTVVTGLRPEAITALVDLDVSPGKVPMAINLEAGLRLLEPVVNPVLNSEIEVDRETVTEEKNNL